MTKSEHPSAPMAAGHELHTLNEAEIGAVAGGTAHSIMEMSLGYVLRLVLKAL